MGMNSSGAGPDLAGRIEALLPLVEKPARYLGTEIGALQRPWTGAPARGGPNDPLTWLLIMPDVYEIGMSHQGLRILYDILNRRTDALAERAFAPWIDMEAQMRAVGIPLFSLEGRHAAGDFDVIGFSLQYELLATNILNMIDLAGIGLLAKGRGEDDPLIAAGGPCAGNPEPVADFFDFILIGDGEELVGRITETLLSLRGASREIRLLALAQLPGVYVPRFYEPVYEGGHQVATRRLRDDVPAVVRRTYLESLLTAPYPAEPVVPLIEAVQDRLTLEIQRGCTHGCRFCQAGMFYRPLRERSPETLTSLACTGLPASGWDEISLSSLSSADYSQIRPLAQTFASALAEERIGLSFSSLRVDTFSVELAEIVARVRKTGFTFAPEAGSQRLRNVINKDVKEEDLLAAVEAAYAKGWQRVKLYFMIGLPTETEEDVAGIVNLVGKVRSIGRQYGGSRKVTASVGAFVPKAHTPFQWEAFDSRESLGRKQALLRDRIRSRWSQARFHEADVSHIEALLSRGDRRLAPLLVKVWEKGARFDGWGDHFRIERWEESIRETGIDPANYLAAIPPERGLPWDHIDLGVERAFLERERDRARDMQITSDCREGQCHACGMECRPQAGHAPVPEESGWEKLREQLEASTPKQTAGASAPRSADAPTEQPAALVARVTYAKTDRLRFIAHLETGKLLQRLLRMTGWPLLYSAGHNPHPKVSFGPPLPLGVEGEQELIDLQLAEHPTPDWIETTNARAPAGLRILSAQVLTEKLPSLAAAAVEADYRVSVPDDLRDQALREQRLEEFDRAASVVVLKPSKGRQKTVDLKRCIPQIRWDADQLRLRLRLQEPSGHVLGVLHVLRELFKWSDQDLGRCRVTREAILDAERCPLAGPATNRD